MATSRSKSIYVEIPIFGSMDEVWAKTQEPALHQRWDLRFSSIEYLARNGEEPQRFLYRTRIGFGLNIDGRGESVGLRDQSDGSRTSSLKFWSDDPKSLIKVGSGYWKYQPTESGVRFFTSYDYETRFGWLGRWVDRCSFRPLIGWATAWSFDRLRLWIEKGISPELSLQRAIIYAIARGAVAFTWFYHGLVPKLLRHDFAELELARRAGTPAPKALAAVTAMGWAEIFVAVLVFTCWRQRWPLWLTALVMLAGLPIVILVAPDYATAAFNPVTLNVLLAALSLIAILAGRDLPTATNCRRKPEEQ